MSYGGTAVIFITILLIAGRGGENRPLCPHQLLSTSASFRMEEGQLGSIFFNLRYS